MIGRTNTGGGGGGAGGSELVIVGGTTRPEKAAENTIWVETENEITSYVLSGTQPETATDGMVWILIGDTGNNKVSAPVGGDFIAVYTLSARQYIDGAWAVVTAKSYHGGEWVDWFRYIYKDGMNAVIAYQKANKQSSSSSTTPTNPSVSRNTTNFYISIEKGSTSYGASGVVYFSPKVDLTNVTTLYMEGDFYNDAYTTYPSLCVWSAIGTYNNDNLDAWTGLTTALNVEQTRTVKLNVSALSGMYYVGVRMLSGKTKSYARIRKIYYM